LARIPALHERYRPLDRHNIHILILFQDAGDKVVASFEDGTSTTVDLLVGADGIHSNIRQQFVADGHPRYSGRIAYRGLFPLKDIEAFWPFDSYAVSWLGKDKHFLVFPVSQNKTMNVVAFITKPEDQLGNLKESWTSVGRREDLEKEYEGWHETVGKVIRCMSENPGKWRLNDRDPVEQWTYMGGKTVLLGDAAHAMLPHQGMFFSYSFSIPLQFRPLSNTISH
jgi:salicylate hydroxylase